MNLLRIITRLTCTHPFTPVIEEKLIEEKGKQKIKTKFRCYRCKKVITKMMDVEQYKTQKVWNNF